MGVAIEDVMLMCGVKLLRSSDVAMGHVISLKHL